MASEIIVVLPDVLVCSESSNVATCPAAGLFCLFNCTRLAKNFTTSTSDCASFSERVTASAEMVTVSPKRMPPLA